MLSGGCAVVYAGLLFLFGLAGLYVSAWESDPPLWAGIFVSAGMLAWSILVIRRAVAWMRMLPSSSLALFDDHFRIASTPYSYSSLMGVKLSRIRTRKSFNLIPMGVDETVVAKMTLKSGVIFIRAGAGPMTTTMGSIGASEVERFVERVKLLEWRARQPASEARSQDS